MLFQVAPADVLQGIPTSGALIIPSKLAYTTAYQAGYVHDDWRATSATDAEPWDPISVEPGIHERNNNISVGFDRNLPTTRSTAAFRQRAALNSPGKTVMA